MSPAQETIKKREEGKEERRKESGQLGDCKLF